VTAIATGLFAAGQVGIQRVTAPFEGERGEPNTLGGYLMLVMSVCVGLALCARSMARKVLYILPALFLYYPLVHTTSRSSYASLAAAMAVILLLHTVWNRAVGWIVFVPFVLLASPFLVPDVAVERVMTLDKSVRARIWAWHIVPEVLADSPFLGRGVTAVRLVDSQYPRVFGETGLIGTAAFLWLLYTIGSTAFRETLRSRHPIPRGIKLGYMGAFAGVLVHCFGANTFLIVRIMEPFWFLTAVVASLGRVEGRWPWPRRSGGRALAAPVAVARARRAF
jgi:hypothetical protein